MTIEKKPDKILISRHLRNAPLYGSLQCPRTVDSQIFKPIQHQPNDTKCPRDVLRPCSLMPVESKPDSEQCV